MLITRFANKFLMKNYNLLATPKSFLKHAFCTSTAVPAEQQHISKTITNMLHKSGLVPHVESPGGLEHDKQQLIKIVRLNGLSNLTYKVEVEGSPLKLVYKEYKHNFDMFVDRRLELRIVEYLSHRGLYPRLLHSDEKCRIQQYIEGQVLEEVELDQNILTEAVKLMAGLSKFVDQSKQGRKSSQIPARNFKQTLQQCKSIYHNTMQNRPKQMTATTVEIVEEVLGGKVSQAVSSVLPKRMVMSHNDANLTNFILRDDGAVCLIDYQFAALNYVGFDLGNFFNQAATKYFDGGFDIRDEWEIDERVKHRLIKQYFDKLAEGTQLVMTPAEQVRAVQVGRLLSHYFWLFIGLKSFEDKDCNLDLNYYILRRKQELDKYLKIIHSSH